jgi:hypothetical protein
VVTLPLVTLPLVAPTAGGVGCGQPRPHRRRDDDRYVVFVWLSFDLTYEVAPEKLVKPSA